jgi:hypothetical protein
MTAEKRPKSLDQVRMRVRTPTKVGAHEIEVYPTHLADCRHLSPSSQNQALDVVVTCVKNVPTQELPG